MTPAEEWEKRLRATSSVGWAIEVASYAGATDDCAALERTRRARLARWQQGTGNERDEQRRQRQTHAVRPQDARSASDSRNSSAA